MDKKVFMGTYPTAWKEDKKIKYITFNVTEDCNLACTYCYFTHKNNKNRMSYDVAIKAVDNILQDTSLLYYDGVVWDFIGGEPTLEISLIDKICDYILIRMFQLEHKWFYCYRFMIGTNGLLYETKEMQQFIRKHGMNLNVNITVDGNKEKHDLSRKNKHGEGSYDNVVKVLPRWFEQNNNVSTKATFAHDDLPFLKDSIINLWNLGFKIVMANVVFENVWVENDDVIFEKQLKELADYIIDNSLWDKYSVRFFSHNLGYSNSDSINKFNYCGSGNMLAIDSRGDYFPCVRFLDSAVNGKMGRRIGNMEDGLNYDAIRAFQVLSTYDQSSLECLNCDVSSGCAWCTGFNYDDSDENTIFQRKTYLCKMHKANVRAAKYFWNRYENVTKEISPMRYNQYFSDGSIKKQLFVITDTTLSVCNYNLSEFYRIKGDDLKEGELVIKKCLQFCDDNYFVPYFVGLKKRDYFGFYINYYKDFDEKDEFNIDVLYGHDIKETFDGVLSKNIILNLMVKEIRSINHYINFLNLYDIDNININFLDLVDIKMSDLEIYNEILFELVNLIANEWKNKNYIQVNILTDNLFMEKHSFCGAGKYLYSVFIDGTVYTCPACVGNKNEKIGNILDSDFALAKSFEQVPYMCKNCNAMQCKKCKYINQKKTYEAHVSPEIICVKENLELYYANKLYEKISSFKSEIPFEVIKPKNIPDISLDPIQFIRGENIINNKYGILLYDKLKE